MKPIEKLLLALDLQNMAKTVAAIQNQIDLSSAGDAEGISLMLVRDSLNTKYTDSVLREKGYILTIAQFQEDAEKFLSLAVKSPLLYDSQLKRLHRSYHVLISSYEKGTMKNKTVIAEIKNHFIKIMLACFCEGQNKGSKMPRELITWVNKQINVEIDNLNDGWYKNKLSVQVNKKFTDVLSFNLRRDWQGKTLDPIIFAKLQAERDKVQGKKVLLKLFKEKKLTVEAQDFIYERVISDVVDDIGADKINPYSKLGLALNDVRLNGTLVGHPAKIAAKLISNWQNNQIELEAGKAFEVYVENAAAMLEQNFESLFSEIAIANFLENLSKGKYGDSFEKTMRSYTLPIAKEVSELEENKEIVYTNVMSSLHDQWISGKLLANENRFIEINVFAGLEKLDSRILDQVWKAKTDSKVEELSKQVTQLLVMVRELSPKSVVDDDKSTKVVSFFSPPAM